MESKHKLEGGAIIALPGAAFSKTKTNKEAALRHGFGLEQLGET